VFAYIGEKDSSTIHGEASESEHHCVLSVLLINHHRLGVNALQWYSEQDGTEGQHGMHELLYVVCLWCFFFFKVNTNSPNHICIYLCDIRHTHTGGFLP
jgi:hypothetical protein